jgi:hypothetical protein
MLAAVLVLTPLLAAAATPTPLPSPGSFPSGIEGVILVSPSHPGPERINEPSTAPAGNVTFVAMKDGTKVASFTTDAEGRFRVSLPPGRYTVMREPVTRVGFWRFEAEVKPGEVTTVRWVGDSGMR